MRKIYQKYKSLVMRIEHIIRKNKKLHNRIQLTKAYRTTTNTIIFIHIPRTSGDSIRTAYFNCFDYDQTPLKSLKVNTSELYTKKTIKGFLSYENIPSTMYNDSILFTILRDPIERILSIYEFGYSHLTLNEFIESDDIIIRSHISNGMVWQLGNYLRIDMRTCDIKTAFNNAKLFLQKLDYVGIFENTYKTHRDIRKLLQKHGNCDSLQYQYLHLLGAKFTSKTKLRSSQKKYKHIVKYLLKNNYYDLLLYNFYKRKYHIL